MADETATRCVACDEEIRTHAKVCFHCRTPQSPPRWNAIKSFAKWTGAIVTIISLVIGVNRVNGLYQQWHERQTATTEMVKAASDMAQSGEYRFAWDMYEQAAALSPGSDDVRRGRTEVAMLWLENAHIIDDETFSSIADPLIPVLYRGLVGLEGEEAATVLGHIAYAYYLKHRDIPFDIIDVTATYERALQFDPDNTFANTMFGHWLIFRERDADRAAPYFEVALKDDKKHEWARGMQLTALINPLYTSGSHDSPELMKIRLALLSTACEMVSGGEPLPEQGRREHILRCYGRYEGDFVEYHIANLDPATQLQMVRWLDDSMNYMGTSLKNQTQYVIARLTEATGGTAEALATYRELASDTSLDRRLVRRIDESIERVAGETSDRLRESRE